MEDLKKTIDEEIENRFRKLGAGLANCKRCNKEIIFIRTKAGNLMPANLNLISHFATCEFASEFRKNANN